MGRVKLRWLGWSSIVFVSIDAQGSWEYLANDGWIGQSWQAAWAFELVGCVFLLWMMIMAYQVYQDDS